MDFRYIQHETGITIILSLLIYETQVTNLHDEVEDWNRILPPKTDGAGNGVETAT
jgi:hypothetical protein